MLGLRVADTYERNEWTKVSWDLSWKTFTCKNREAGDRLPGWIISAKIGTRKSVSCPQGEDSDLFCTTFTLILTSLYTIAHTIGVKCYTVLPQQSTNPISNNCSKLNLTHWYARNISWIFQSHCSCQIKLLSVQSAVRFCPAGGKQRDFSSWPAFRGRRQPLQLPPIITSCSWK